MDQKPQQGGVVLTPDGAEFAVWSRHAVLIELCLFDADGNEKARLPMTADGDIHRLTVKGVREGNRYGYRAHGRYEPDNGLWFDPSKLLADPYARIFDRPFVYDARLGIVGEDTQALMPKAVITADATVARKPPLFTPDRKSVV